MKRLRPGFRHCYAMKLTEGENFWHIVNPRTSHIDVTQELVYLYPHPRVYAAPDAILLNVTARIDTDRVRGKICLFNCVEVVKGLLGIDSPLTLTPYQLYCYLLSKNNG